MYGYSGPFGAWCYFLGPVVFVYRLTREQYATDLSGSGARLYGGRWNPPGLACLYTCENRALAALELLVNTPEDSLGTVYTLITLQVSEVVRLYRPDLAELPEHWQDYPCPITTQNFGAALLHQPEYLGFFVPSVVMPYEYNLVFNVFHPDFSTAVQIAHVQDWRVDGRLKG